MYRRLENHFGRTRWDSMVMWVMWNVVLVCLEMELASVQYRCTLCVEHTVGIEIVLNAPGGTPRRRGSCGIPFQSV
jgi:hypothetical protein